MSAPPKETAQTSPKINRQKSADATPKTPNISRFTPYLFNRREIFAIFRASATGKNRSNAAPRKRPLQYPRTGCPHVGKQNRRSKGESTAYKKILSKFLLQFHTPTCDDQFVV
jgi:hypothetical protein